LNPDPHWEGGSESGSRRAKMATKVKKFSSFESLDLLGSLLMDEDFSVLLKRGCPLWRPRLN